MNKVLFKTVVLIILLNLISSLSGSLLSFLTDETFYLALILSTILIVFVFFNITKVKIDLSSNNAKQAFILICPIFLLVLINALSIKYGLVNKNIVLKAIYISFYAAVNEELLMRIVPICYYNKLTNKGNYISLAIITSAIFSLFHLINILSGANIIFTILQIIQAFGMGMLFSSVYIKTRNIYPLLICHFLLDFFALLTPEINNANGTINYLCLDIGTIIQTILTVCFVVVGICYLRDNRDGINSIWEK